ncbi:hypothetical protein CKO19_05195 [Rhodovulum adriaticum]|nr:hypothetical protein [Rhodovulum adriaticum]
MIPRPTDGGPCSPRADQPGISPAKLLFDKLFAALALLALAPAMAVIAILLRLSAPGPVLCPHTRIGKDGRAFRCFKFRTMRKGGNARLAWQAEFRAEGPKNPTLDQPARAHRIGRFLRRTGLDELPQFWNVLIGDMSVVGPRPIFAEEAVKYGRHFTEYCAVRPGITGAWQVSGRRGDGYAERIALDSDYVRNASFLDDLRIMLRTVGVVLGQRGAM